MLIDINAYVGHWPFRKLRHNTLSGLVTRMNRFSVDKSVVSNLNGIFYKAPDIANRELHEALHANPQFQDRVIPFAVLNPAVPWWERALEEAHEQYGMKGVRLYPLYHKYSLTESRSLEMVRAIRDRGMAIAIPQRMVDLRMRSWLDVDEQLSFDDVAELVVEVPDAKYMMLDTRYSAGDRATFTASAEDILKEADILFDTTRASGTPIVGLNGSSLPYLHETYGAEKIAFGTGTPFTDYSSPFFRIEAYEEADQRTKDLIWSGNVRRMLDI